MFLSATTKSVRFHGWTLPKGSEVLVGDFRPEDEYGNAASYSCEIVSGGPVGRLVAIRASALPIDPTVVETGLRHRDGLVTFA